MKLFLLGTVLTFSLFGQQPNSDSPRFLLFGGGSVLRIHASGAEAGAATGLPDFFLEQRNLNFNLVGWNTTVTEDIKPWFGADADFSGEYGTPVAPFLCSAASISNAVNCFNNGTHHASVTTKLHTFTFGPRFTMHRFEHFRPYAHVLLGYAFISGSLDHSAVFTPVPAFLPQGYSQSTGGFAVAPGVGADLPFGSRFAIRLFELDYFMTRFYSQRQDNARLSAGIVFQFNGRSSSY